MESEIESKLKNYLSDLKSRREALQRKVEFCQDHGMHEEVRWLERERNTLSSEYVEIHNKVLGIFF